MLTAQKDKLGNCMLLTFLQPRSLCKGNLRERDNWGNPDIDGRIILRWIFKKWEELETGWSWLRIGTGGGHL